METFHLLNEDIRNNCIRSVLDQPLGKVVKIVDAGSKSSRQRGYEWMLYKHIAKQGVGGKYEDSANGVHLVSKYRFCLPILLRDDEYFADIWKMYVTKYSGNNDALMHFVECFVHTEDLSTPQMAEYLTNLIDYYASKEVYCPPPDDPKLLIGDKQ